MDEMEIVEAMKALGQPTRLRIIQLLAEAPRGLAAGNIADALKVRQNTLSTHIAVLGRTGLIDGRRDGRSIVYMLDKQRARQLSLAIKAAVHSSAP
jgi:ArsR family transcriptional regulator, arsenate/arsenite/antimonite-responsive transcriptional repressor